MAGAGAQRLPRSARRVQLLDAAQAVFVSSGYHNAAMDEIADRAGVSKPVLYQHFPGKLELYIALVDRQRERLLTVLSEVQARVTDNKEQVLATVDAYFEFVDHESEAFRLLLESDLTNQPEVARLLAQSAQETAALIAEAIAADTAMPPEHSQLLGMALSGMAQTSARAWLAGGRAIPRGEAARLVGQLAWRGLGGLPLADDSA